MSGQNQGSLILKSGLAKVYDTTTHPSFAIKYFVPVYDPKTDLQVHDLPTSGTSQAAVTNESSVSALDTLSSNFNFNDIEGQILWNLENITPAANYEIDSSGNFLYQITTTAIGQSTVTTKLNSKPSSVNVIKEGTTYYQPAIGNPSPADYTTYSANQLQYDGAGVFSASSTFLSPGIYNASPNTIHITSYNKDYLYSNISYAGNQGDEDNFGEYKIRLDAKYGSFKFNKIILFGQKVDTAGNDETGAEPFPFAVVTLNHTQTKTRSGDASNSGSVSDFSADIVLAFSRGSASEITYNPQEYFSRINTGVGGTTALEYAGSLLVSPVDTGVNEASPKAKIHVISTAAEGDKLIRFSRGQSSNSNDSFLSVDTTTQAIQLYSEANKGIQFHESAVASGAGSIASGTSSTASGQNSMARGVSCSATSAYSKAEGISSTASNNHAQTFGEETSASGAHSLSRGYQSIASGSFSTAVGPVVKAIGGYSDAQGDNIEDKGQHNLVRGRGIDIQSSNDSYNIIQGFNVTVAGANNTPSLILGSDSGTLDSSKSMSITNNTDQFTALSTNNVKVVNSVAIVDVGIDGTSFNAFTADMFQAANSMVNLKLTKNIGSFNADHSLVIGTDIQQSNGTSGAQLTANYIKDSSIIGNNIQVLETKQSLIIGTDHTSTGAILESLIASNTFASAGVTRSLILSDDSTLGGLVENAILLSDTVTTSGIGIKHSLIIADNLEVNGNTNLIITNTSSFVGGGSGPSRINGSVLIGDDNTINPVISGAVQSQSVNSNQILILGDNNTTKSQGIKLIGNANNVEENSDNSYILGRSNLIDTNSDNSYILGRSNFIDESPNSYIIGGSLLSQAVDSTNYTNAIINSDKTFIMGTENRTYEATTSVLIGRANNANFIGEFGNNATEITDVFMFGSQNAVEQLLSGSPTPAVATTVTLIGSSNKVQNITGGTDSEIHIKNSTLSGYSNTIEFDTHASDRTDLWVERTTVNGSNNRIKVQRKTEIKNSSLYGADNDIFSVVQSGETAPIINRTSVFGSNIFIRAEGCNEGTNPLDADLHHLEDVSLYGAYGAIVAKNINEIFKRRLRNTPGTTNLVHDTYNGIIDGGVNTLIMNGIGGNTGNGGGQGVAMAFGYTSLDSSTGATASPVTGSMRQIIVLPLGPNNIKNSALTVPSVNPLNLTDPSYSLPSYDELNSLYRALGSVAPGTLCSYNDRHDKDNITRIVAWNPRQAVSDSTPETDRAYVDVGTSSLIDIPPYTTGSTVVETLVNFQSVHNNVTGQYSSGIFTVAYDATYLINISCPVQAKNQGGASANQIDPVFKLIRSSGGTSPTETSIGRQKISFDWPSTGLGSSVSHKQISISCVVQLVAGQSVKLVGSYGTAAAGTNFEVKVGSTNNADKCMTITSI